MNMHPIVRGHEYGHSYIPKYAITMDVQKFSFYGNIFMYMVTMYL